MGNLTKWAIDKSQITFAVLFLILCFGIFSYLDLSKAEDPGFTVRSARITTFFPGASPERIEALITDKLEKAAQEMPEIDYITSESRTGASIITVQILEQYKNMRPIWDRLRRKIERITESLPEGVQGPFVDDEFGEVFGIILSITGDGFNYRQMKAIADQVRDELLFLPHVAKVDFYGEQQERIFVEYRDAKLTELGISAKQLKQILEETNIITPGGFLVTGTERIIVEPTGNFESIDDLKNAVIAIPGKGDVIYLADLVDIKRGYIDPPLNLMHTNGQPSLALAISMMQGGNILSLGKEIKQLIQRLEKTYPIGIQFDTIAFQPAEVGKKVHEFLGNLLQSVAIVLLVMLLTLGLRTGLVVATLIPMTILSTLIMMSFFHIGIDQISLAALIISLGILVDNAIVISESILTESKEGKSLYESAIASAQELKISLLTSSLTTAAAFLPIYLAKTTSGEYTAPLFQVVTIALLSSWILSLTMIPLLCVRFLRTDKQSHRPVRFSFWKQKGYQAYHLFLRSILRYRTAYLLGFIAAFSASLFGFHWVPKAFFPPSDRALLTAELALPSGTKIEHTHKIVEGLESYLDSKWRVQQGEKKQGVAGWAAFIGGMAPRYIVNYTPEPPNPEKAYLMLNTTSAKIVPAIQEDLEAFFMTTYPQVRATIQKLNYGPPVRTPIAIRISGKRQEEVFHIVDGIKERMRHIPGMKNVRDNWGERSKKVVIQINQAKALRAGITNRDVAASVQTFLSGYETTKLREEEELIPILLRSTAADRENIDRLETLTVYSQATSASVPLKQVADLKLSWQTNKVMRRDRFKTVTIEADLEKGVTANDAMRKITSWIETTKQGWPSDLFYEIGGERESAGKASRAIERQLPLAGLIILFLLILQFNSYRLPLIILLTIPLGIIGVVIGLLATSSYFGFMTLLGIVSLSGIVINNAIVLLDRIGVEREELKKPAYEAILNASTRRLRPIFLTTVTTICGLLPLWLDGGTLFAPMAISIIFGLFFATFLTLGFVPLLYSIFYRINIEKEISSLL